MQHLAVTPGAPFKIGDDSRQIVMSASGKRLYIPYVDDITQAAAGGVAIVEVSEASCAEILWRHLDGCPHCDLPDCVVLATIENYHLGDRIEEQTDPPADPAQDAARQNRAHRQPQRKAAAAEHGSFDRAGGVSARTRVGGAGTQGLPARPAQRATKATKVKKEIKV